MKKLLMALALLVCCLLPAHVASAHVLVTDESGTKGAVIHSMPDDDITMGVESTVYFDMQGELGNSARWVKLVITNPDGTKTPVKVLRDGALVTAPHTFTQEGTYRLAYTISTGQDEYVFHYTQQVASRAVVAPLWAQIVFFGSIAGLLVIGAVVIVRRKKIAHQSTF
jgi:hypothetical protein